MNIPEDIAAVVRKVGRAEWGATAALDADGHAAHVRQSVTITAKDFDQTEPQPMNGLYVAGSETVICHTGTSPNSGTIAQALTGAWNRLCDEVDGLASPLRRPDEDPETFGAMVRLNSRIHDLELALEQIRDLEPRPKPLPADHWEQIRACPECQRYADHPVQRGVCNEHRRPMWDKEKHDAHEEKILGYRAKEIARNALNGPAAA